MAASSGWIVFGLVLVAVPATSGAQNRPTDSATVRALDDQMRLAVLRRDIPALEQFWSDQLVVNAPNNAVVHGKRAVIEDFVRTGIINFSSFERDIQFMRAEGDFVITMGLETLRALTDSPANGLRAGDITRRRFTNIWRREGDTWRLYIRHANVIAPR
jgi:ketosteroid isomerase-like protein